MSRYLDGVADAFFKAHLRLPSQLALQLGAVERVTAIVAGAIFDVLDEQFGACRVPQDGAHTQQVLPQGAGANVVDRDHQNRPRV